MFRTFGTIALLIAMSVRGQDATPPLPVASKWSIGVNVGKPILKGTRPAVEFIQGRLADGWTNEMLLENYPSLKPEDIPAIHAFILEYS